MGRHGNNEGSISRRKDARWMGRYTVDTADGPKQRAIYGKNRADAAEKLTKAMADRASTTQETSSRLERGHNVARGSTIRKLADDLDVEPRQLMKGENDG